MTEDKRPMSYTPSDEPTPVESADRQAMDRLNEQNRILTEARMLDNKVLSDDKIAQTREHLKQYIDRHGIRLSTLARQVGYADSTLSTFINGTYPGATDKIARVVNDWMERDSRRQQSSRSKDYVETWVAEDIRTISHLADKRSMMTAIVVPSGAGKTFVLRALVEEMRGAYVYCHRQMSAKELLVSIATAIGTPRTSGSHAQLHRLIVKALAGSHRILFLDEAHQLGKAIGAIRALHDEAQIPIVMAGTVEILEYINDRSDGRGQFSSRTIRYNAMDQARNVERPDGSAGRDLFTLEEITAFFAMKKIRLDTDAMKLVWLLACLPNWGCLRLIEHTVETVFDLFDDVKVITRSQVLTALRMLHGADAAHIEKLTARHMQMTAAARVA